MMRALMSTVALVMTAMPLSSDVNCGNAYAAFLDHIGRRSFAMAGEQLVTAHRNALRIFDACDSGHLENAEKKFRDLEKI